MNNTNVTSDKFAFYVKKSRIRAYELNKPWEEARVFEYIIADKKIILYTGKEVVESFWSDINTFTSKHNDLYWTPIPLSEAFMHPIFKELFLNKLNSQCDTI